jgi:hypothetical protein
MDNTIIVFTLNGCIHCNSLKQRLKKLSIPYIDVEITKNENIWNQVVEQTGHDSIPTIFIKKKNTDDGPVYVPGRDYESEDEIVEIIKKYI